MVERYEFRVFRKYVSLIAPDIEVPTEPSKVAIPLKGIVGDTLYVRIGNLARELKKAGLPQPFGSWNICRSYTKAEIQRAELFAIIPPLTHLAAEEFGTKYDESASCTGCGLGSKQIGNLRITPSKLPQARDIIRLWGGELVISRMTQAIVAAERLSGTSIVPMTNRKGRQLESFSQLVIDSDPLELTDEVIFGNDPFEEMHSRCSCEAGEIAGSKLLSRLAIKKGSWQSTDFCHTRVYVGSRAGLFRPHQILVVSKRCFDLIRKLRGFTFEIVDVHG